MQAAKALVVVLEDNQASAEALCLILQDWGAEVVAGDRLETVRAAIGPRETAITHIIADFNLGQGANGVEIARALQEAAPAARIMVLTGSFKGRADAYAAAAGLRVMIKPAQPDAIVDWLESD